MGEMVEQSEDLKKVQEDRAFLRERYLKLITKLSGKKCDVKMFENTEVSCTVKAFDPNFKDIIVGNLVTPVPPPIKSAILRGSDIIYMNFQSFDIK